jgi:thioredoxin 1
MKSLLVPIFLSCLLVSPVSAGEVWQSDLKEAFKQAKKSQKPVVIKFWATWCGTCTQMSKGPLADKAINKALGNVIPVALNVDDHKDLTNLYRIQGLPTLLFVTPSGVIFNRTELFVEKAALLPHITNAQKESDKAQTALIKLEKQAGTDHLKLTELGNFYQKRGNYLEAAEVFERIFKNSNLGSGARQKAGVRACDARFRISHFAKALKQADAVVKVDPKDPLAAHALFLKGYIYENTEKPLDAKTQYAEVVKSFPLTKAGKAAAKRLAELAKQ